MRWGIGLNGGWSYGSVLLSGKGNDLTGDPQASVGPSAVRRNEGRKRGVAAVAAPWCAPRDDGYREPARINTSSGGRGVKPAGAQEGGQRPFHARAMHHGPGLP